MTILNITGANDFLISCDMNLTSVERFDLSSHSGLNPFLELLVDLNWTQEVSFPITHATTHTIDLLPLSSDVMISERYAIAKLKLCNTNMNRFVFILIFLKQLHWKTELIVMRGLPVLTKRTLK